MHVPFQPSSALKRRGLPSWTTLIESWRDAGGGGVAEIGKLTRIPWFVFSARAVRLQEPQAHMQLLPTSCFSSAAWNYRRSVNFARQGNHQLRFIIALMPFCVDNSFPHRDSQELRLRMSKQERREKIITHNLRMMFQGTSAVLRKKRATVIYLLLDVSKKIQI